jgi:hypothetical protein
VVGIMGAKKPQLAKFMSTPHRSAKEACKNMTQPGLPTHTLLFLGLRVGSGALQISQDPRYMRSLLTQAKHSGQAASLASNLQLSLLLTEKGPPLSGSQAHPTSSPYMLSAG